VTDPGFAPPKPLDPMITKDLVLLAGSVAYFWMTAVG
jgi:hypothetical protein